MARSPTLLAVAAVLSMLLGGAAAKTVCAVDLKFITGPKTAALAVGGKVIKPAKVGIKPVTVAGVAGSATVVFDGACPTAGGLAAALLSASLSPVTPTSGIRTGLMESRIWSIAKVDCNDFQAVFESTGPVNAKDGTIPFNVRATSGTVNITRIKTGRVRTAQLAPEVMTGAGCRLTADPAAAGQIRLDCPNAELTRRIETEGIAADIAVKGPLTALGTLASAKIVNV